MCQAVNLRQDVVINGITSDSQRLQLFSHFDLLLVDSHGTIDAEDVRN